MKNRIAKDRLARNRLSWIFRVPLFRLLAINLAIGVAAALLMITGLLLLNPYGLRTLLLSDRSGATVFVLMLFGFIVTFGSTAMGTAIMMLGRDTRPRGGKGAPEPVAEPAVVALKAR
jgi:hypothetical protein